LDTEKQSKFLLTEGLN